MNQLLMTAYGRMTIGMKKKLKGTIKEVNDKILTVEVDETLPGDIKDYEVVIQKATKKRGLDANALSWVLIDRLAKATQASRDEVYDLMLQRYGVATYLVVKPSEAQRILSFMEHGRILGDININGHRGTQLQIFIGSSQYDKAEFSHYLSGIISECELLNLVLEDKDVFADAITHWS